MAALHPSPPISSMVTLKEGEYLLASTEHPATAKQLGRRLTKARAPRQRNGQVDYYDISDVLVAHRDLVDQGLVDRPLN